MSRRIIAIAALTALLGSGTVSCTAPLSRGPATYYVSADGDDTASGLRPGSAWASLERATDHDLQPGETIILTGDRPLRGTLRVTSEDAGDPEMPVTITADETFPGIEAVGKAGIDIVDTSGVEVSGIHIRGVPESGTAEGVLVSVSPGGGRHTGITLRDLTVEDIYQGVAVGALHPGDGYDGVTIDGVEVTDAQRNGILTFGPTAPDYAITDLRITNSVVTGTTGLSEADENTGSGFIIGSVDGALVDNNESSYNGGQSRAPEGPIGLWTHDSTNVVIRDNTSHHNQSGWTDGGGFGVDISATDVLLERNLAHDNHGAGFLVYTHGGGAPTGRVTARYNASVGDGLTDQLPAGFAILGGLTARDPDVFVHDIHVHHNTFITPAGSPASGLLVMGTVRNLLVHHNIVDTAEGTGPAMQMRRLDLQGDIRLEANQIATSAPWIPVLDWDGEAVTDVTALPGYLPGASRNMAGPVEFVDRSDLPRGLAPLHPAGVEIPQPTMNDAEPAATDLLGDTVAGAEDIIGAVSRRG